MVVMVAPTAIMARAILMMRIPRVGSVVGSSRPPITRPIVSTTRRTSRGMMPTVAIPLPALNPRPSALARV